MRLWPRRVEQRDSSGITLASPNEEFLRGITGGANTDVGKNITPESAIGNTIAVFAAVSLIADSVSTLPMMLYEDQAEGDRRRVSDANPFARLLHRAPNPEMTAQEFYETITGHVCLWGNAYAAIERQGGRPAGLWPLRPDRMTVMLADAQGDVYEPGAIRPDRLAGLHRVYVYQLPDNTHLAIDRDDILHVRGLGTDGYVGLSPIGVARNAVAMEQAAAKFGAGFYANSAIPKGLLEFPPQQNKKNLTKEEKSRIKREWNQNYGGFDRSYGLAILEGGVKFHTLGMPMEDAQFLETRKFQVSEIARIFRVPPHLIGEVDRSTSWGSGIAEQNLGFLTYTLRPWLERIEQAINRDLGDGRSGTSLSDQGFVAEFLIEGLLRGTTKERFEAYEIAIRNKLLLPNEARRAENLAPLVGGDEPFTPLNMGVPSSNILDVPVRDRITALGELIRAGFDPAASAQFLGIDVAHTGLRPITVQEDT